jgi:hypothetical protein
MSSGIVDDVAEWTLLPTRSVTRLPLDGGRPRTTMLDERAARPAISAPATC